MVGGWMVLGAMLALSILLPARADDSVAESFEFEGKLGADGVLAVTETLVFGSGRAPDELSQAIPATQHLNRHDSRLFQVDEVTVRVDGSLVEPRTTTGDNTILTIPTDGAHTVTVSYRVVGATRAAEGDDQALTVVEWPVLRGLSVGVETATGVLNADAPVQLIDCQAGPPDSVAKCHAYAAGMFDSPQPSFSHAGLAAGDEVQLTAGFPADAVAVTQQIHVRWSMDRAFDFSASKILAALGVALLGAAGLFMLHRRGGTDLVGREARSLGGFRPVGAGESVFGVADNLRPGLVGTVADERVDPVDVTATLLDLAVRGHLLITELPHEMHGLLDWRLTPTSSSADELLPFERDLLDALGEGVLASELPVRLAPALAQVQSDLYDEVVARGWFESRPDSTRGSWRARGYVALGAAVVAALVLIAFTGFGLLAVVLIGLACGLIWVADRMPRRTAAGSEVLGGLQALSVLLATHPTDQMPASRELAEISAVLPYAVVLGGKERWLQAMADADRDDDPDPTAISWYHAPETWHLRDLPASLTQFIHTIQGELFGR